MLIVSHSVWDKYKAGVAVNTPMNAYYSNFSLFISNADSKEHSPFILIALFSTGSLLKWKNELFRLRAIEILVNFEVTVCTHVY